MKLSTIFLMTPLAIIAAIIAIANRGPVSFFLDPFSQTHPALVLQLPLYILLFAAFILGVVLGGMVMAGQFLFRRTKSVHKKNIDPALMPIAESASAQMANETK